jgi:hypothetical protein
LCVVFILATLLVKNRGCPSHFPDNELMKVMEWVWGVVAVTYYIGNLI